MAKKDYQELRAQYDALQVETECTLLEIIMCTKEALDILLSLRTLLFAPKLRCKD